jgi:hypothetical protein
MMTNPTVQVGERSIEIRPFRGFKAVHVGRLVAEIMRLVPDLLDRTADFTREYEQRHAVVITREMEPLPQFRAFFERMNMTDEDWRKAGGKITLPAEPSQETVMAAMFPVVFEAAEPKVMTLLAWIIAGNDELRTADESDSVSELIARLEKSLLHDADLDQLLEVAIAGSEIVRASFMGKGDRLAQAIGRITGKQESDLSNSTDTLSESPPPTQGATNGTNPDSSISSPTTTNGPEAQPSTVAPSPN